jgi:hypothetical protein
MLIALAAALTARAEEKYCKGSEQNPVEKNMQKSFAVFKDADLSFLFWVSFFV